MTRKSIENKMDGIIAKVVELNKLNPATEAKGGEIEVANSLVWLALRALEDQIVAATAPPVAA